MAIEEDEVTLKVAGGDIYDSYVVLRDGNARVRMTYEYPLVNVMDNKYREILQKFNVNKNKQVLVVPAPMHFNGTYMLMGMYAANNNDKFWALVRSYSTLRFNTEFVSNAKGDAFIPVCMSRGDRNTNEEAVVVPDATLQAPKGYRFVVVLHVGTGLYLFGARDRDNAVFRVPTPNMSFGTGHLCEGHALAGTMAKLRKANALDANEFIGLINSWESAQWNSDLTGSLPHDYAKRFLRWNIHGKQMADTEIWDDLAADYPLSAHSNDVVMTVIKSTMDTYMTETDHVTCGS